MTNGKTKLFLLLFFFSFGHFIFAQTDSTALRYYRFVLADSSAIVGSIISEDESVIQIKSIWGSKTSVKRSDIKEQSPVALAVIEKMKGGNLPQDSTVIIRIELKGGSELMGRVVSEDSMVVKMKLLSGTDITIKKENIETQEIINGSLQGNDFFFEDPNATRLLFGPTGRSLKSGEGYFAVYELFFPMVAVGVGDILTLSGGLSLFPGMSEQLLYLAPKITVFQSKTYAVSIGDFFLIVPGNSDNANIMYAVSTYTKSTVSLTGGLGYEFVSDKPVIMVGADVRVSRYAKFVTENWFFSDSDFNFISLGVRFMGRHLAADFAFVIPVGTSETNFVPWVGFAYNF